MLLVCWWVFLCVGFWCCLGLWFCVVPSRRHRSARLLLQWIETTAAPREVASIEARFATQERRAYENTRRIGAARAKNGAARAKSSAASANARELLVFGSALTGQAEPPINNIE